MAREFYTHQNWCQQSLVIWPVPKRHRVLQAVRELAVFEEHAELVLLSKHGEHTVMGFRNWIRSNLLLCTQCLRLVTTDIFDSSFYHEFQTQMYTQYITSFAHLLLQQQEARPSWPDDVILNSAFHDNIICKHSMESALQPVSYMHDANHAEATKDAFVPEYACRWTKRIWLHVTISVEFLRSWCSHLESI